MAKKAKSASNTAKKAQKGFVLSVGDEGAILSHFDQGALLNRIFVDSPYSPDIKLMKKLFDLYPHLSITVYVDTVEQNYVHATLPPLSASAVKKQAERKMKRDFQPNDLTNFIQLGREKEGRKDWKFLFISLANTEPFSNWVEFALEQKNKFAGIYVLAIEAQEMIKSLNATIPDYQNFKWELVVMHNKISGFRIIAFNNNKIYFTRLTQNIVGENVAEVVAGNLEQEITNTIEYLKRLGYSGEQDTHLSIIANLDVLKKIELSRMKFARVDRYTPYSAAEKLGLQYAIKENDKYADILCSTHFAVTKKKSLKFNSKFTKEVANLQNATFGLSVFGIILLAALLFLTINLIIERPEISDDFTNAETRLKESTMSLQKLKQKEAELPKDIDVMVEVLDLERKLPAKKDLLISTIYKAVDGLSSEIAIQNIEVVFNNYTLDKQAGAPNPMLAQSQFMNPFAPPAQLSGQQFAGQKFSSPQFSGPQNAGAQAGQAAIDIVKIKHSFEGKISFNLNVRRGELDILNDISTKLLQKLQDNKNGIEFTYETAPKTDQGQAAETVTDYEEMRLKETVPIPVTLKFMGVFSEEKKFN